MEKTNEREKRVYEPPKATFVPLKIEERLLGCGKIGCSGQFGNQES